MDDEAGPSNPIFSCHLCSNTYKYKKGLTAHIKKAHQQTSGTENVRVEESVKAHLICSICMKEYKTTWGLAQHEKLHTSKDDVTAVNASSNASGSPQHTDGPPPEEDIFDAIIREEEDEESEVQLSGASIEVAHAAKRHPTKGTIPSNASKYKCTICGENFASRNRFEKHSIEHKLQDCYARQIDRDVLSQSVEETICSILREIISEGGDEQKKFVDRVLGAVSSGDWNSFVTKAAECISGCIYSPKAIIPSVKYEEQLVAFNKLLNNDVIFPSLLNLFKLLAPDDDYSSSIPGMVLYRVLSKLFEELSAKYFNSMRVQTVQVEEINPSINQEGFEHHVRKFIQGYYAKGVNSGSALWISRCACVRRTFIENLSEDETLSVETISKNSSWENNLVKLNSNVVKFFLSIEDIITSLLKAQSAVSASAIIDSLFQEKNLFLLEPWHSLTASSFPMVESIAFMKELLSAFVKLSLKLEVDRLKEINLQGRPGKYALRTDLKRN